MSSHNSNERTGKITFTAKNGKTYQTWYKVLGDPTRAFQTSKVPLVILHGGPAIPNPYMSPHEKLFGKKYLDGAPIIFYDQIGGGKSSHPHNEGEGVGDPETFYTVELFMDELDNVLNHFGLLQTGRQFDILGHSWGGMLAAVRTHLLVFSAFSHSAIGLRRNKDPREPQEACHCGRTR